MNRTIRTMLFASLLLVATPLVATSLSVVPLGEALQNPDLVDTNSEDFEPALAEVQALMLNQPADETEREFFRQRVSNLARYRNTRVGKLFFEAVTNTPAAENLPEGATFAELTTRWPLSFGSFIRIRVAFEPGDDGWLISVLEVTADGLAAAPISGMAPYFGAGDINAELLNAGPIDYLVGRDPADREKLESERAPFDFDAAIKSIFAGEKDAYQTTVNGLLKDVTPETDASDRIKAMTPHLESEAEVQAMIEADADPERSLKFWEGIFQQLKQAATAPRPDSVPQTAGSDVSLRYRIKRKEGTIEAVTSALRLESGNIAPRGGISTEGLGDG